MTTEINPTPSQQVVSNIRAEIARRRVSQRVVAERLGISQPAFSARLAGKTSLDIDELFAIADLLEVDPAALLGGAA
jgi:transcriptional regulator with XRE-family HTH domain